MNDKNKLGVYFTIFFTAILISFFTIETKFAAKNIGVIIFFLVFLPALIQPSIGFVIIIFSSLFSPGLILGTTSIREITIRVEDVFLLMVLLAWLVRAAYSKDIYKIFRTRLTLPFFSYIAVCIFSTIFGLITSSMDAGQSFFSILKYFEYFLLFLVAKEYLKTYSQAKFFVAVFLVTTLFASIHSNIYIGEQIEKGVSFFRTAPPVESRGGGEAGTLGGYLLFIMAITIGLFFYARNQLFKIFLGGLILLMFRAFLYTLSRGSYLAFLPMLLVLAVLSRKINFIFIMGVSLVFIMLFMPTMVRDRITQTVTTKESLGGSYVEFEESPRFRLESWNMVLFERFPRSPIFGHGVGRYFIDSQLFLTLCETGLLGILTFGWVLIRLFGMVKEVLRTEVVQNDGFAKGITIGFLGGFSGLLVQAISTNTFIIIRIMEPFWIMAAIVLSLPSLLAKKEEEPV